MDAVSIQLLGIGAVRIHNDHQTIYVDAFSEYIHPVVDEDIDLILVTHDDHDHFGAEQTAQAALDSGATVAGPPGIAYPLLTQTKLPADRIHIIYPIHLARPITEEINGIRLKVYQTRHFIDWEPPHVSYLVELNGERIYLTGDSNLLDDQDPDLQGLDALVFSLVPPDLSAPDVMDKHIAALKDVQTRFHPQTILPNHLIRCDWTVDPDEFRKAVAWAGLNGVEVFTDEEQRLEIFSPIRINSAPV
jgi:L-ascorbate metabolism protein UlaG (beta-lactamase superfamily)